MSNNQKPELIIFKAVLKDNKIFFERNSSHIPTLDYVVNELQYNIIELRTIEKTKQELAKQSKIIKPGGLIDFLRRGNKR